MSIVMTLVCVLLSLGWGGAGMAQDRPPEIVIDPEVEAPALPDTEQADRADAERRRHVRRNQLTERLPMVSHPGRQVQHGLHPGAGSL